MLSTGSRRERPVLEQRETGLSSHAAAQIKIRGLPQPSRSRTEGTAVQPLRSLAARSYRLFFYGNGPFPPSPPADMPPVHTDRYMAVDRRKNHYCQSGGWDPPSPSP